MNKNLKNTYPVSDTIFRDVYDSPAALPGRYKWLTCDEDVRKIEELLGRYAIENNRRAVMGQR